MTAKNWAKVDALIWHHPKVVAAGTWGGFAFITLLLINKRHGFEGRIPTAFASAAYLAREVGGDKSMTELMEKGLAAAHERKLIDVIEDETFIVGWDDDWGLSLEAARKRRARAKARDDIPNKRVDKKRSEEKRIEESRVESHAPSRQSRRVVTRRSKTRLSKQYRPHLETIKTILEKIEEWTKVKHEACDSNVSDLCARLNEGRTEKDLRLVVWSKGNEWSDDAKMKRYIKPTTLFGKKKFAEYLAQAEAEVREAQEQ